MSDVGAEHPGNLISAYLDQELHGADHDAVADHLRACARCNSIMSAEAQVRLWTRAQPDVEPPAGFIDRLIADGLASRPSSGLDRCEIARPAQARSPIRRHRHPHRHPWRYAAVNLVAAAVVWVAVIAGGRVSSGSVVQPRVGNLVSSHQARTLQAGPLSTDNRVAVSSREGLPAATSRFQLRFIGHDGQRTQAVYSDGQDLVSVFREVGTLNWGGLRDQGTLVAVGSTTGVVVDRGDVEVLMFERGAFVYAVVAPPSTGVISELAVELPGSRAPSLWERAGDAAEGLAECFALEC
jgi:hypothetical protein